MTVKSKWTVNIVTLIAGVCASVCLGAVAEAAPGVVVYVQGNAKILHAQGGEQPLALGSEVVESDTVTTDDAGQVRIRLFDRSVLRLGPNSRAQMTQLRMDAGAEKKEVSVKLVFGKLWASVTKLITPDSKFEVQAANAVAGVRGTLTGAEVDPAKPDQANIFTIHGSVEVTDKLGNRVTVPAMSSVIAGPSGLGSLQGLSLSQLNFTNDALLAGSGDGGGGGGGNRNGNAGQGGGGGGGGGGRGAAQDRNGRGERGGGQGPGTGAESVLRNPETASAIRDRALERLRDGQARLRARIDLRE
jgi:hypothetical protein